MWKKLAVTLAIAAAGLLLVVRSFLNVQRWRCEACMTFGGETRCQKASGATREEAARTAIDTACAPITAGMGESVACSNSAPQKLECRER